ncbi:MAG: sugar transferase [Sulfobacillus sp.]
MAKTWRRWYPRLLVAVADMVFLFFSTYLAFVIRFRSSPPIYNWHAYQRLSLWQFVTLLMVFYLYGLYGEANHKTSSELRAAVTTSIIVNGFFTLSLLYFLVNIGLPRTVFFLSVGLQIPIFLIWRSMLRSLTLRYAPSINVLAIGTEDEWHDLTVRAGQFLPRIRVVYAIPGEATELQRFENIGAVVLGTVPKSLRERYFLNCMALNIPCLWTPDTYDLLVAGADLTTVGESPMFSLASIRTRHGSAAFKRTADIGVSLLGLVLCSSALGLIALAIYMESGRPIIYRQERVAAGGRTFWILKFRTMVPNAEVLTGPVLSSKEDPRVTRLGRILRTSHLDELPQLWNILKGDMSLVGPRPERPTFVNQHRQSIAYYDLRHVSPPGLTGLAQVAGSYSSTPEDKARFDLHYAKSWSWWKDFSIIVQTLLQWPKRKN